MKNYKILIAVLPLVALASCSPKVKVEGVLVGSSEKTIVAKRLEPSSMSLLDTLKTDKNGKFSFKVKVEDGQPEFVYLFCGDRKIASLILEKGESVTLEADTLGNYTTAGSKGSALMEQVDKSYSAFASAVLTAAKGPDANGEIARLYVDHYRESVKFVMSNPTSLACIPVLYERLNDLTPIFAQSTDAIHFRKICDSLKEIYPNSRYVRALEAETQRRENVLEIEGRVSSAKVSNYPEITLPSLDGEKVALSGVDAKVVMIHFWNSAEPTHKMFNLDVLQPLYEQYHDKGFEIYSISFDTDKAAWASVVKSQNLSWINVVDTRGAASTYLPLYNVQELPTSVLIADGTLSAVNIKGEAALKKELSRLLK